MSKRRNYEELPDISFPADVQTRIEEAVAQADHDLADGAARSEVRVNFRWGQEQLDLVRQAAALADVPYQTYLKQAVYRQAVADLKDAAAIRRAG
jgi:predicted DNA binding CopG/RHH family protein